MKSRFYKVTIILYTRNYIWQLCKEIQKSSEMKFDGKLIKVTYDIADVNGNEAWREVVHHPGATAIVVVTEDNKIVMERQFRYALQQPFA